MKSSFKFSQRDVRTRNLLKCDRLHHPRHYPMAPRARSKRKVVSSGESSEDEEGDGEGNDEDENVLAKHTAALVAAKVEIANCFNEYCFSCV